MTCTHVLGLIDAGPFAGYPPGHLDAAWRHARHCPTCGPALDAATALTADLAALPRPAAPPDLTASVLARISQVGLASPVSAAATMAEAKAPFATRDWSGWATALSGVGAALAIVMSSSLADAPPIEVALPTLRGTPGLVAMPEMTTGTLLLAAGLVLYAAGLFAPLSSRTHASANR